MSMGGGEMYKAVADMPEKIRQLFKLARVELPETSGNYKDRNFGVTTILVSISTFLPC